MFEYFAGYFLQCWGITSCNTLTWLNYYITMLYYLKKEVARDCPDCCGNKKIREE